METELKKINEEISALKSAQAESANNIKQYVYSFSKTMAQMPGDFSYIYREKVTFTPSNPDDVATAYVYFSNAETLATNIGSFSAVKSQNGNVVEFTFYSYQQNHVIGEIVSNVAGVLA